MCRAQLQSVSRTLLPGWSLSRLSMYSILLLRLLTDALARGGDANATRS